MSVVYTFRINLNRSDKYCGYFKLYYSKLLYILTFLVFTKVIEVNKAVPKILLIMSNFGVILYHISIRIVDLISVSKQMPLFGLTSSLFLFVSLWSHFLNFYSNLEVFFHPQT